MFKQIVLTFFTVFGITTISNAQLAHEIGFIFGPVAFQSDYGQRHDKSTNVGNTGFGIGAVHWLNFSSARNNNEYFNEHFKIRSEISFSFTNFEHFGRWVEGKPSVTKEKLKAMSGKTSLINVGTQLNYSPFTTIHEFERYPGSFYPYLSIGAMASYYSTHADSSLGPLGIPATTPDKYLTPSEGNQYGFSTESGVTFSVLLGVGVQYKLDPMNDLLFEVRYQGFDSDWIDGLNPNRTFYKENKAKDSQVWFNFGYSHYLEF
ncbi:THC0290_0291 family protein [Flavobacterium pectinovorum]|uniref:THC0290_0291 family protein n=1 Tax=Flavobacterium pectinovorum TaxID=29533 RepID=UPI001FAE4733|nr:glutamate dehydrogenase [Flavobacterium pectinovorum]MCI9844295.1 glutamate dehydrogenase [Flavobacterium pectinovorum]